MAINTSLYKKSKLYDLLSKMVKRKDDETFDMQEHLKKALEIIDKSTEEDVNYSDNKISCLHLAVQINNPDVVAALIAKGANVNAINDRGVSAFVLKYRMPNKVHQIPLEDVERSYDIIKELAGEYGLDISKVGVFGSSAGGHLAASYSIYSKNEGVPAFAILLSPAISFDMQIANVISSRKNLIGDLENGHPLEIQYSLEKHVSSNTPPTFIVAAFDDKVVPLGHSIWYFNSLLKNNVKTALHIYPEGGHGFGMNVFKYKEDFLYDLDSWLKKEIIK